MSCISVSTLKLLTSNFLSSHINYLIYFSNRMKFYRLVKSFNGSINIRMQRREKSSLHILQNIVHLTDQSIINLRTMAIFRAKGLPREKGTWGRAVLIFLLRGTANLLLGASATSCSRGAASALCNKCLRAHASATTLGCCLLC